MDMPLFTEVDPDALRAAFRHKSRKLSDKTMGVAEAVASLIHDGDYLEVGGFGGVRIPTAILHEIVRQRRKDLGFSGHTATHDCEILAAGKCINRCDAAYIVGLEARGMPKTTRKYFEGGAVQCVEWTNGALSWRLKAAAMGLSFLPARNMLGTDTQRYSAAKEITCPFTGAKYLALPALSPDVGIIHVHEADIHGNCHIKGILVSDVDLARASKRVIVTCERLVPPERFRDTPGHTTIPYFLVDAVVEVPFGSYPGNMPYEYFSDEEHLAEWLAAEESEEALVEFVQRQIYGCKDFYEYLDLNGGVRKLKRLQELEHLCSTLKENGQ